MKKMFVLLFTFLVMFATNATAKDVSTYLVGDYVDVETAKNKLSTTGYEIVASYESVKDGVTIVFTNSALKSEAAKPGRAHAAVLRLFVDAQEKKISLTNPLYFGKAFMQDDYNEAVFNEQFETLSAVFTGLQESADKMDADNLAGYHFMMGMPYYSDVDELSNGEAADLLQKVNSYKDGKFVVFTLKISDEKYLVGYDLDNRTKKFVEKIGRANAAVLPYCIAIENKKATAMEAKYYLAVSYPLLTMTEFTTIATVPGAISKHLEKPFK
ncbi:MAG TPA: hypothetical protein CFH84_01085 [Sulfurimonas sp. UBA12504]|nr:MAG: hypothetical protein A2019_09100 [Sulfurimonas sp. GWF2_37_8]DAB30986.1 MAG TPA: hypothetical protein CFH84_01085 [Sulfurimonas sp. UBA12504]